MGYAAYRLPRRLSVLAYVLMAIVPSTIVALGESAWEFLFFALNLARRGWSASCSLASSSAPPS